MQILTILFLCLTAAFGMAFTTVESHFLKVNQVLCDITGYDEKERCQFHSYCVIPIS